MGRPLDIEQGRSYVRSMNTGERRQFLLYTMGASVALAGCASGSHHETQSAPASKGEQDIAPPEDLMREHGVLNRILLVYDESAHRLEQNQVVPLDVVTRSAEIIKNFIEQYHEKLEEDYLFPRFEKAGKLVELVATLRRQHEAGRDLTRRIIQSCTAEQVAKETERGHLIAALRAFVRMYRPHEAREDTVLFPALRSVVDRHEFEELGERFEDKEHALFGKQGFEGIVQRVEAIERELGIFDLNQFTP